MLPKPGGTFIDQWRNDFITIQELPPELALVWLGFGWLLLGFCLEFGWISVGFQLWAFVY